MLTKNGSDLVKVLNNNMRCFEMSATSSPAFQAMELNNNMRCFEILAMKIDLSNVFVKQ